MPRTETENTIASVWREVLEIDQVSVDDNFFDLGGHSLLIVRLQYLLQQLLQTELAVTDLFEYPTIRSLAKHLSRKKKSPATGSDTPEPVAPVRTETGYNENAIAIIGMAAKFPGCRDLDHFWDNLSHGTELISRFSEQDLHEAGIDHALVTDAKYVRAGAVLVNIEMFDATFFKFSPREARLIDVQQRIFLECAWEALEQAGYDADSCDFPIGIFGGAGPNDYLTRIHSCAGKISPEEFFEIEISNDREQLAARAAYKLNLRGPSINVQTACSTSLVAVHMACQSLIRKECQMALAGGVSVRSAQKQGYLYQQGGIYSPDGHCRAFDAKAQGTVPGNGAGVVVLKRLRDAINAGDSIHAVILGSAVNNDGSSKIGYTAPSVAGQFEVISQALRNAGVSAATINCIEAHGTGTPLGDPVEVAALTKAFRIHTIKSGFCALGSVKTNMGHLGPAAGIAGLIKIVLALKHKQLPPSLHFVESNPAIDFARSPFFVITTLRDWTTDDAPRRAGVSSFGIGGTNAHVVLQEAPAEMPPGPVQSNQLLLLSAKTSAALEAMTDRLVAYLKDRPDANLADIAYTYQVGRRVFDHRRMLVCNSVSDAFTALEKRESTRTFTGVANSNDSVKGSSGDDLESLGQLWLKGAKIDWQRLQNGARRRVHLPTYPFERQRYWIERTPTNSTTTTVSRRAGRPMRDWFYVPLWKQSLPPQSTVSSAARKRWLVFCYRIGVGRKISEALARAGHEAITVDAGVSYARISDNAFSINPDRREDYFALIDELRDSSKTPDNIIHSWAVTGEVKTEPNPQWFNEVQKLGFYSLVYLAQALVELVLPERSLTSNRPLQIQVLSNGIHDVTGDEELYPEKATILGPCKTIPQEYPAVACSNIDITLPQPDSWTEKELVALLMTELGSSSREHVVAYRGTRRWIQNFEPLPLARARGGVPRLQKKGVYLLTGGLGRDSLSRAGYLAQKVQARLVLVGRSALPEYADDEIVAAKFKAIQELEALGSEVLILKADVADEQQMRSVIDQIDLRFGTLDGVIHAAGVTDKNSSRQIPELTHADCERHFQAKVYGAYVLEKILRGRSLDFCLLTSSLASIRGGVGLTAYAAANIFMDMMAHKHNREEPVFWTSLNWQRVSPEETAEAFERVLCAASITQIITSVSDLQTDLETRINLDQLRALDASSQDARVSADGIQETVAEIWRDLLILEKVDLDDNFLELGGDSLLAVQLLARIRRNCGVELTVRQFFEDPTLAGLTEAVSAVAGSRVGSQTTLVPARRSETAAPLSHAQRQLWFMSRLRPDDAAYNVAKGFRLQGELKVDVLERSLVEIIERHDILRTTFQSKDNQLLQITRAPEPFHLHVDDLSDLPERKRSLEASQLLNKTLQSSFDLAKGPLFRVRLIRENEQSHVLLFVMHHIIIDAWSLDVFNRELSRCYTALCEERTFLNERTIQYADYANWQQQVLNDSALQEQLGYWKRQLSQQAILKLPTDRPRPTVRSHRGAVAYFELTNELTEQLKRISRDADITLFMTLLTAYSVVLWSYIGQEDISIGTPFANRRLEEFENVIGLFANTLVLRVDLRGNPSVKELLDRVRKVSLDALAHSDVPFDKVVEELKPQRDLSRSPLFQVSFIMSNLAQTDLSFPGVSSTPIKLETHTSKFDLTLAITESAGRLRGTFEYSIDLFEAGTIQEMIKRLISVLEEMPNRLDTRIKDLLLLEEEKEALLHEVPLVPVSRPQWETPAAGVNLSVLCEHDISQQLQLCAEQLHVMTSQLRSLLASARNSGVQRSTR